MGERPTGCKSVPLTYATWHPELGVKVYIRNERGDFSESSTLTRQQIKNLIEVLLKGL